MTLTLKAKLKTWASALRAYDAGDLELALELFLRIPKSSIILTNIGLIHAALGEHAAAVEAFLEATFLDPYLAVACFQCGVSNFLLGRYEFAYRDFQEAHRHLRGNQLIDYEQIGLSFKLFSAEILFNQGLCLIQLNKPEQALDDLQFAAQSGPRFASTSARSIDSPCRSRDHDVIDDALRDLRAGELNAESEYTVFSVPPGVCYRPSEKKLANAASKDYIGEARLIAAVDLHDLGTGFTGPDRVRLHRRYEADLTQTQQAMSPSGEWVLLRSASLNDIDVPRTNPPRISSLARITTTCPDLT